MTPATLGPMACISRKLPGLYFWPTIWDTRAGEAHETAAHEGDEDAQLGGRAQQQGLGVGDEGTEVRHSAHAHEDQAGIDTQLDA